MVQNKEARFLRPTV